MSNQLRGPVPRKPKLARMGKLVERVDEPRDLVMLSRARQMLAEAVAIDEIKRIRDKAQAVKSYGKKIQLAREIIIDATIVELEAQRKLGQLLQKLPLAKSAHDKKHARSNANRSHAATGSVRLRDIGISKSESSRAQRIARLSEATFKQYINDNLKAGREPSMAGALRLARDSEVAESISSAKASCPGVVDNLDELVKRGCKFKTIMADPPWPYQNQGTRAATSNHYPTMSLEEIRSEPVTELAAKNCHLHLWTTTSFLPAALELLEVWKFEFKSQFIWAKPTLGLGNYWRVAHEILLLGVRGHQSFLINNQRSWLEEKRTKHSAKPPVVRKIIERVSPAPYLEMYGRQAPASKKWTVYGNQISAPSK